MKVHIVAVGSKMPDWVTLGYQEYARRLPASCRLNLIEVPAARRGKGTDLRAVADAEGAAVRRLLPVSRPVIALERDGRSCGSVDIARSLEAWMRAGEDVAFVIGGPEGLSPAFLAHATDVWSLSALTFPHGMVRVIVAEQIYRSWSLLNHHRYHRGAPV
ncbi:MAG: 23S rRNA (pseudouridine(1915)-N(3))-methyltransferase RlmH [Acidiferrobacteraceae bacterium]